MSPFDANSSAMLQATAAAPETMLRTSLEGRKQRVDFFLNGKANGVVIEKRIAYPAVVKLVSAIFSETD